MTLLIEFGGLLGQVICQIDSKATLSVDLAHPNSLEIPINAALLICHKDFGQMVDSIWVFELLRPGSSYGGLLETHLRFLLLKVQQSLLDICAAHCDPKVPRGLRVQLGGHLGMPSGIRHRLRWDLALVGSDNALFRDADVVIDVAHLMRLPVAQDLDFLATPKVQLLHDLEHLAVVRSLLLPLLVLDWVGALPVAREKVGDILHALEFLELLGLQVDFLNLLSFCCVKQKLEVWVVLEFWGD